MRRTAWLAGILGVMTFFAPMSPAVDQPELGRVQWGRDLKAAQAQSRATGRPILLLFQEVPGCSGCRQYGAEVLSNPLIVEAAEDLFIPVVVFNSQGGADREILQAFKEPAFNFQVVRYLDAAGRDLIPREEGVWSVGDTAQRMAAALRSAQRPLPRYVEALAREGDTRAQLTGAFAMGCFWDGEAALGGIPGVVATEAAFIDGHEAVRVTFDPREVGWAQLVKAADAFDCAQRVYAPNAALARETRSAHPVAVFNAQSYRKAPESDQKHALRSRNLRAAELTPTQATKVNAGMAKGEIATARGWLSPRQAARL